MYLPNLLLLDVRYVKKYYKKSVILVNLTQNSGF